MGDPTSRYQTFASGDVVTPEFLNEWIQDYIIALRGDVDAVSPNQAVIKLRRVASLTELKALTNVTDKEIAVVDDTALYVYNYYGSYPADEPLIVQSSAGPGQWLLIGGRQSGYWHDFIDPWGFQPDENLMATGYFQPKRSGARAELLAPNSTDYYLRGRFQAVQPGDKIKYIEFTGEIATAGAEIEGKLFTVQTGFGATIRMEGAPIHTFNWSTVGVKSENATLNYEIAGTSSISEQLWFEIRLRNAGSAGDAKISHSVIQFQRYWIRR